MKNRLLCHALTLVLLQTSFNQLKAQARPVAYHISPAGNDANPGTIDKPWRQISRVSTQRLMPGDSVLLEGGQVFRGSLLLDSPAGGSENHPIVIGSYGNGVAMIDAGEQTGIYMRKTSYIHLQDLILRGIGRKNGNNGRGIWAAQCDHVALARIDVSGFQKSGVEITDCQDIRLEIIQAHDNGYAGIAVTGNHFPQLSNYNVYIGRCTASDNPGDPTELNNHSGNGIIVGLARNVLIEYCSATNNGWDMPRKGNGPVGIWAWEADSLIIQHCVAYRNKTAPGAADGGGFDLDGGVTNSIVQYNLAYENQGYGFGIFQFSGATPWYNNVFRYNISYDDGNRTQNGASVLWWNGSRDSSQFHDCYVYQNLLYNSKGYALGVVPNEYQSSRFFFLNNIIVAKDELMSGGHIGSEKFFGNDWWSLQSGFKFDGNTDFGNWTKIPGLENLNGLVVGSNTDPMLLRARTPTVTTPANLHMMAGLGLKANSALRDRGLDLLKYFQIHAGGKDFLGKDIPVGNAPEPGPIELR